MESERELGKVVVAPEVLLTIVRQTALETEGVARLYGKWPEHLGKLLGIHTAAEGIGIQIEGDVLTIDIHIVAKADAQMLQLGRSLQQAIARAIHELVGLEVKAVNVHIEDVELEPEAGPTAGS